MIEWKEKKPKRFVFEDLKVTDAFFVDFHDNNIFMKTTKMDDYNAVSLKTGKYHYFNDEEIIHPTDLVIEYSLRT